MAEVEAGPDGSGAAVLREARMAQALTVGWMVVEGSVAIGAGLLAHSVALTAFGADSAIELFSSLVVLRRLLERSPLEERGSLTTAERTASRLVGFALAGLAVVVVASSGAGLLLRIEPRSSPTGVALTTASLVIMAGLWRWRLALAARLGSPALHGDAACSRVCLWMAAAALGGLALNLAFGLWWADSLAALALTWWIVGEAREAIEAGSGEAG